MNTIRLLIVLQLALACSLCFAEEHSMDTELSTVTEKLAASIKNAGNKKVTVLDFTDLQGESSELGKYVAEQLTVNLVSEKRDFSVLDRANLKTILAEHKLTATGLVNPENAKQLGKFAGVDALILGTFVSKGKSVGVTAKIITTETAEIVGAAKGEFKTDETVDQLMTHAARSDVNTTSDGGTHAAAMLGTQKFGNLQVNVNKISRDESGFAVDLTLQNKGQKNSIGVMLNGEYGNLRGGLTGSNGARFVSRDTHITGLRVDNSDPKALAEIEPAGEIRCLVRFWPDDNGSTPKSVTLQLEFVVTQNYSANTYANYEPQRGTLPPNCKVQNLLLDIPTP